MATARDGEPTSPARETTEPATGAYAGTLHEQLRAVNEQLLLAGLREQERAEAAQHLADAVEQRALHDGLTGLPNRALLHDRLRQLLLTARRDGGVFALLFIDLDGFKAVNDRFGHQDGDALLRQVAMRLRAALRGGDTVARLGGDEFAVLLPEVGTAADAARVARHLDERLRAPFTIEGVTQGIGASIGIARYPEDGADAEALLRRADAAMYHTKRTRRGGAAAPFARRVPVATAREAAPDGRTDQIDASELNEHLLLAGLREQELAERLRVQLAFTAAIAENVAEGVCAFDVARRITFANPVLERLLGRGAQELVGRDAREILPEQYGALGDVLRTGTGWRDDDSALSHRDGPPIPVACSAAPLLAGERVVGAVLTVRDITTWKQLAALQERANLELERRVAARTAELADANARLGLIFAQLPAIVWTTDRDLCFTFSAGAALTALGVTPGQLLGLHLRDVMVILDGVVYTDEAGTPFREHRRALHGEQVGYTMVLRGQRLQLYVEPLRDAAGRLIGVIGVAQDITELSVRRLHDDFIATVSHQLLTPLASARAGIGLLREGTTARLDADERHLLANIGRNIERLGIQLNDLLALNRLKAGAPFHSAALDLRTVVAEALTVVEPLIRAKGQGLTVDLPRALRVMGDGEELLQAVINLVFNAHRHTPSGTQITIVGRTRKQERTLTIRDNGPGIPVAARASIFRRFQRLEGATGVAAGSGLGLAIVWEIAERHGGRVWAAGVPGGGTSFHLALPRHDDAGGDGEGRA